MVSKTGRDLVFLVSTPRAGSTLLAALLGSHPDVLCPPESWLLLPLVGFRDDRLLVTAPYDHQLAQQAVHDLLDTDLFNQAINSFAVTVYNSLLQRSGKRLFVDKTPRYYHILPSIETLFPAAKQIWLKRN